MDTALLRTVDVFLEGAQQPIIIVLGPTASGKTSLSIDLAQHSGGEVVNADSRQLYKFLDIGTAKITKQEMHGVPHHLLDRKDPKEELTVGWYQQEATAVISDILNRGRVPLLVGGSMLYISSIVDGLTLAPAGNTALRMRLEEEYDRDGGATLFARLSRRDPDAAHAIHQNNRPVVIRSMEICEVLNAQKSTTVEQKKCSYDLLMLGVFREREELIERIEHRAEAMLHAGWIEEVQGLMQRGYSAGDPGLKSHGYREIMRYLEELEQGGDDEGMLEKLKQRVIAKTRQYAKRQMTWWRGDARIRWIAGNNT